MEEPGLAFVAALHVTLSPALRIGEVGHGQREIIPITGGTVSGPLLNGRILPGGEDWALDGEEGRFSVWARYALELDDGTLVTVDNRETLNALQKDSHTLEQALRDMVAFRRESGLSQDAFLKGEGEGAVGDRNATLLG